MEISRQNSPFAGIQKDWDLVRVGYYIVAIVKWDIKIDDFQATLEEAISMSKCSSALPICNTLQSASNETLQFAHEQMTNNGPPVTRAIFAAILHSSSVLHPQAITVCQAILARTFFLCGAYGMLRNRNVDDILAAGFAKKWEKVLLSNPPLRNTAFSGPALIQTIRQIYIQKADITDLLSCAATASGVDIGTLVEDIKSQITQS
jgi:hypothetical protein